MNAILGLSLLVSTLSFASVQAPESQSLDLDQFKGFDPNKRTASKVQFSSDCKGKSGAEYKSSDAGYESCMREMSSSKSGDKGDSAASAEFTFGN